MEEIYGEIGESALLIFFGTAFGSVLNYLTRVLIGRFYGPSGYGVISIGLVVLSAAATASLLGMRQGIARWISYYYEDRNKIKAVMISALKIGVPVSILISYLFFVFSRRISVFLGEPSLMPVFKIFCLAVPFYALLDIFVAGIRGLQNSRYKVYTYDLIWPALKLILVSVAVFLGLSLENVVGFHVVAIIFSAAAAFIFFRKLFPILKVKGNNFPWKKLILFSWPLMVSSILFIFVRSMDIFMIGYFKSSYEVGIYNAALPTASALIFVLFSFKYLFMPKSSELFSEGKKREIRKIYKTVARWIFLLTFPALVLMTILSEEILTVFFGPEFSAGWIALIILALGYFYASFVGPTGDILISIGKTKLFMTIFIVITSFDFVLNFLLIPKWSIAGAASALAFSFLIGWSLSILFLYRELKIQPFDSKLLKPLALGLSLFPLPYILNTAFTVRLIGLLVLCGGYLILYSIGLYKLDILESEEKKLIKDLKNQVL